MINFTVDGEPKGKGRPRFTRQGRCYTPKDTLNYERLVALEYKRQVGNVCFDENVPLAVTIFAGFQIPKGTSTAKRQQMLNRELLPTKKPDCDNIIKIVCDALNGVAYYDDKQIVQMNILKCYGAEPYVHIAISEMGTSGCCKNCN
jgi:Holliday junction resolvase RusA-like endonuclease